VDRRPHGSVRRRSGGHRLRRWWWRWRWCCRQRRRHTHHHHRSQHRHLGHAGGRRYAGRGALQRRHGRLDALHHGQPFCGHAHRHEQGRGDRDRHAGRHPAHHRGQGVWRSELRLAVHGQQRHRRGEHHQPGGHGPRAHHERELPAARVHLLRRRRHHLHRGRSGRTARRRSSDRPAGGRPGNTRNHRRRTVRGQRRLRHPAHEALPPARRSCRRRAHHRRCAGLDDEVRR